LSHTFDDPSLLELALSHRSWCAENAPAESNERLEFLGDAVLGLSVADHLFVSMPTMPEGHLAKVRSSTVSAPALAAVARRLQVGQAMRLGKGEAASGGADKASILADAMEAIIGAVYLDGGFEAASRFVVGEFGAMADEASIGPGGRDYKTRLQELTAQVYSESPSYKVSAEGPDHLKTFSARVRVAGVERGTGTGKTKKEAEQAAASVAWNAITAEQGSPEPSASAPSKNVAATMAGQ